MKAISLLLLSLIMVFVNPAFGVRRGGGGGMSQTHMDAAKQKMTTQSDQAADQNAQPKTDAAPDQTKPDNITKQ